MESLGACTPAEADTLRAEMSSLEEEVCEGGVVDAEEEEELGESLKDVTEDKSVKPIVNCIMSSSSFTMLTVQGEDSGIIWETVSSSRCSTPWASESTVSDANSVESTSLAFPPGKVIFLTDALPRSSAANGHRSNRKGRSGKRRVEPTDPRPGDALKTPRNNACVARGQAGKAGPAVISGAAMDDMTNSRLLKDWKETQGRSQSPLEHRPTPSKVAGKSDQGGNVAPHLPVSVEDDYVPPHAPPVHCRKKRYLLDTVSPNEQSPDLSRFNNLFSTTPEQHLNIPPAKPSRKPGESEATKRFSDRGPSSALHERNASRLPPEIGPKPMRVSRSKETCEGTEYLLSPSKAVTANGTICTGKGELRKSDVTGSDNTPSSCHETSIPEGKGPASSIEASSAALGHGPHLNESPTGLTLKETEPHHFPQEQEVVAQDGQTHPMAHPEVKHQGASSTNRSGRTEFLVSAEVGVSCEDVDDFVPVIKDGDVGDPGVDLQNSSFTAGLGRFVDAERQEAEISDKLFYPRANPDLLEALDVKLNGSFHGTEEDSHSFLVGQEDGAGKSPREKDREIQRAALNFVADGPEMLKIIAPVSFRSLEQEARSTMQGHLTYLQTNPVITRQDFTDGNSLRLLGALQHSSWEPNPFTTGTSKPPSAVHSDHFQATGSTSNLVGSNPSDGNGNGNGSNTSHEFGSDPSQASGSNPSHGMESNPPPTQTSNPSTEAAPNSTSAEHSPTASTKGTGKDVDYFEKYTLVDERVPIEMVATEEKRSLEMMDPGLESLSSADRDNGPSTEDAMLFDFDEFQVHGDPGSCLLDGAGHHGRVDLSVRARTSKPCNESGQEDINDNAGAFYQKETGSLLFDTTEGILPRSHNFPVSTKLLEIALLEEPPALAFYYKDLYEEAKGQRGQDDGQSDEDGSDPDLSFPCQSSDTDEGDGLYFEKYVLKDDMLESTSRVVVATEWTYARQEGLSPKVVQGRTLFSEWEGQFPAMVTDEAGVPDSEKAAEVQKAEEEEPEEERGAQEVLPKPSSTPCEEVSEEAEAPIELKEEDFKEMSREEAPSSHISPPEKPFHAEDIMSMSSDVEERSDSGHLPNTNHSFEEYGDPFSEPGLEDVNTMATLESKDTPECTSKGKTPVYELTELAISKEELGGGEDRTEDEDGLAPAELEQEADQEGLGETANIEHKAHHQISEDGATLETEDLAPQMLTEGYGDTVPTVGMDEEVYKSVGLEGEQLLTESTGITGARDEKGRLDLGTVESTSKEKAGLQTESQGKPADEGDSQGEDDVTPSEVNDYQTTPDLAGELQERRCLADDWVKLPQSQCETTEMPTHKMLPDVLTYEQDSGQIFEDIPTEQKDSHGTISKIEDLGVKPPQDHRHQEIIQDQADDSTEAHLHEDQANLSAKETEEEPTDFILLADVKIIEGENGHTCLEDLETVDKEVEEINQKATEELSVQTTKGEDVKELITPKAPKPADTFCVTCGFPIYAIDKLFGEHQDHHVIAIDTAVVKVKEKLDDFVKSAQVKASRIEEFLTELEDSFNAVEENCTKEEKYQEEQHEEVMKLLLSQYTEMSQVLEEEKKMKLEHLCDQMVHYRCNIDSTKETAEKTKESVALDDMEFLKCDFRF